jgi:tetratricopeptide (TPR) repeat protein
LPASIAPSAAVAEKLAQGDRALSAGDLRAALFAYQDAVYLQPGYAFARVKLGRTYLALRYPDHAAAQAERALADDPGSPDARRLLEDARNPAFRAPPPAAPQPQPAVASPEKIRPAVAASAVQPSGSGAAGEPASRVYRLPFAEKERAPAAAPALVDAATEDAPPAEAGSAEPLPPAASGPSAAQRYRTALDLVARREYAAAVTELSEAIAAEPRLAVAYAARASAQFGLGRYRDAADDYKAALGLDPALATPLYGLAECYRLLGDPLAAEMYGRYASSRAADVREDLRAIAVRRAGELAHR